MARRVVLLAALLLAFAAPVHGRSKPAPVPAAQKDAVQALVDAAAEAVTAKNFGEARRALAEAYRKARTTELLLRMAEVERLDGRAVPARDFYRRYLAEAPDDAQEGKAAAKKLLAEKATISGELSVVSDRGALVLLDDQVVGVLPLPLPLLTTPGAHKLAVELGKRRQEDRIDTLPGRTVEVRFPLNADLVVVTMAPALLARLAIAGLPEPLQRQLFDAVSAGAQQRKLGVQLEAAALLAAPELASCAQTAECQKQLARKNLLNLVLSLTVTPPSPADKNYTLAFEVYDANAAEFTVRKSKSCASCGAEQLVAMVTETTTSVIAEAQERPKQPVAAKPAEVKPPVVETPLPVDQPKKTGRPLWRLIVGPLALAAGIGLIGAGAAGLAINQNCVAVDPNDPSLCQSFQDMSGVSRAMIYDTFAPGVGLVVAGGALTVAGVVLLALPGKKSP